MSSRNFTQVNIKFKLQFRCLCSVIISSLSLHKFCREKWIRMGTKNDSDKSLKFLQISRSERKIIILWLSVSHSEWRLMFLSPFICVVWVLYNHNKRAWAALEIEIACQSPEIRFFVWIPSRCLGWLHDKKFVEWSNQRCKYDASSNTSLPMISFFFYVRGR